jgi:phage terminase small subunit
MPTNPNAKKHLDLRQEQFCLFVASGSTKVEAWLNAGYSPDNKVTGPWRLLKLPRIMKRIRELQARFAAEHGVTVGVVLAELDAAREHARKVGNPSAEVAAVMGKAKLLGYLVEKIEDVTQRKPSLIPTRATEMSEAAWLKMVASHLPGAHQPEPKTRPTATKH